MGQVSGKAAVADGLAAMSNLPTAAVEAVWKEFNLTAEGWGMDPKHCTATMRAAMEHVSYDTDAFDASCSALFKTLDTDENDIVDALELMVTLSLISGMDAVDKLHFAFNCYDFDETGNLTLDEITLVLKSVCIGLSKVTSNSPMPSLRELEEMARLLFQEAGVSDDKRVSAHEFARYCVANPITLSWIDFTTDLADDCLPSEEKNYDGAEVKEAAESAGRWSTVQRAVNSGESVALNRAACAEEAPSSEECEGFKAGKWVEKADELGPEEPAPSRSTAPDSELSLQWVHGFNNQSARGQVRYCGTGRGANDFVFPAGTRAVIQRRPREAVEGDDGEEEAQPERQLFNMDQNDLVGVIAVSDDGRVAAAGGSGDSPLITVFDTETSRTLAVLRGFHSTAVCAIAFDASGEYLLSASNDPYKLIAVSHWRSGRRIFTTTGPPSGEITSVAWASSGNPTPGAPAQFMTCGTSHVLFWTKRPMGPVSYIAHKAIFSRRAAPQPMLCSSPFRSRDCMVTGSSSGMIFLWEGRNCTGIAQGHDGPITNLHYSRKHGLLISGGRDGKVCVWNDALEPMGVVDLLATASVAFEIRSAVLNHDATRILVGTSGGDIVELVGPQGVPTPAGVGENGAEEDAGDVGDGEDGEGKIKLGDTLNGGPLVSSHFRSGVYACAANPSGGEYVTGGADRQIRVWDAATHRMIRSEGLDTVINGLAFSPDGATLAVSLGPQARTAFGESESKGAEGSDDPKAGAVVILNAADLSQKDTFRDASANDPVVDIRFSADGSLFGVLSEAGELHVHSTADWTVRGTQKADAGDRIVSFDFSADGSAVMCNTAGFDMLFFGSEGDLPPKDNMEELRALAWGSSSCVLSYTNAGVLPADSKLASLSSIERSTGDADALLLTAQTSGQLRFVHFPSVDLRAPGKRFHAHAGRASKAVFLAGESPGVVSVGAADGCVLQWALEVDEAADSAAEEGPDEGEEEAKDAEDDEDDQADQGPPSSEEDEDVLEGEALSGKFRTDKERRRAEAFREEDLTNLFDLEDEADDSGEAFAAVQPWIGGVVAPSDASDASGALSGSELTLEWVYGCSTQTCRQAAFYNADGDVVYPAAGVGVVLHKASWSQRHLRRHTDSITAIARHPDRDVFATAQVGACPLVCAWRSSSMETVREMRLPRGSVAVSALAFSPDGNVLAAAGQDANHTVHFFDWRSGVLLGSGSGGPNKILTLCFNRDGSRMLQGGMRHFRVWRIAGRHFTSQAGLFSSATRKQKISCSALVGDNWVMGSASGKLLSVDVHGRKVTNVTDAHTGEVGAITAYTLVEGGEEVTRVITGGKDGYVKVLDQELAANEEMEFDLQDSGRGLHKTAVRSICVYGDHRKMLVGTAGCELTEIAVADGSDINDAVLVSGHCKRELWGLAAHPIRGEFATVGDDKTLRVWNMEKHRLEKMIKVGDCARAVCYAPNGHLVGVGMGAEMPFGQEREKDGAILVVSRLQNELRIVHQAQDADMWIRDIKFSPNGACLAAGSEDNNIYLYNALDDFTMQWKLEKHGNYVTRLDFSKDSKFIQSNTGRVREEEVGPEAEEKEAESKVPDSEEDMLAAAIGGGGGDESKLNRKRPPKPAADPDSNCSGLDHFYFEVDTAEMLAKGANELRDTEWDSYTCLLGWSVQGVWPKIADDSDVNAVSRAKEAGYVVAGDAYGKVRLLKYPSAALGAAARVYSGHGGSVSNVCVSHNDGHVISVGRRDRCAFQWKVTDSTGGQTNIPEVDVSVAPVRDLMFRPDDGIDEDAIAATFDANADRPWVESALAPAKPLNCDPRPPSVQVAGLPGVFGFTALAARNCVHYNLHGNLVFAAGRFGVVRNKRSNEQLLFSGHTGPITSLVVSRDGLFAASGQAGPRGTCYVWDACTGRPVAQLAQVHRVGVLHVAFSADGRRLATVGAEDTHTVALYETRDGTWNDAALVAAESSDQRDVYFAAFTGSTVEAKPEESSGDVVSPIRRDVLRGSASDSKDAEARPDPGPLLVTGGKDHVLFWYLSTAGLRCESGRFEDVALAKPFTAGCAASDDCFIVGAASGEMYVWNTQDRRLLSTFSCTDAPVTGLVAVPSGNGFVAGCANGDVVTYVPTEGAGDASGGVSSTGPTFRSAGRYDSGSLMPQMVNGPGRNSQCFVAGLSVDSVGKSFLIGTRGGAVYELAADSGRETLVLEGHAPGHVTGVDSNPKNSQEVVTCGVDGMVRVWDLSTNCVNRRARAEFQHCRCVAWSPDGTHIAVGLDGGETDPSFMVVQADTMEIVCTGVSALKPTTDIKYSSNGATLGVSSFDCGIHLFDVANGYTKSAVCELHSGPVLRFDFGTSGSQTILRSTSANFELLYFDAASGNPLKFKGESGEYMGGNDSTDSTTAIRGASWTTETVPYAFHAKGAWWPDDVQIRSALAVRTSGGKNMLATAETSGAVKLYNYPASGLQCNAVQLDGHSAAATDLAYSQEQGLFTVGADGVMLRWELS